MFCGYIAIGHLVLKRKKTLTIVIFLLFSICCNVYGVSINDWKSLKLQDISSVSWSPDGKYIAFMATKKEYESEEDWTGPDAADIWLYRVSPQKGQEYLQRILHLTRKEYGIPVGIFWLANDRIAWASQNGASGEGFTFLWAKLDDKKPRKLTNRCFDVDQSRDTVVSAAPDDVCWDAKSRQVIFTGFGPISRSPEYDGGSVSYIYFYNIDRNILITKRMETGVQMEVTISANRVDDKFDYFIAALYDDGSIPHFFLWRTSDVTQRPINIVRESQNGNIYFPRVSPDSKLLAYISSIDSSNAKYELVLSKIDGKQIVSLCKLKYNWESVDPAFGCMFSWSPSGDSVALSTGSSIDIIDVKPYKAKLMKTK